MAEQKLLEELQTGDFLKAGYNKQRNLLVSNYPLLEKSDLQRLEEIGVKYCTVREEDDGQSKPDHRQESQDESLEASGSETSVMAQAQITYRKALDELEKTIKNVHENRVNATHLRDLKPFLKQFIAYIGASPASVSCLTQIQQFDDKTYHHSLNVSLLCLLYGHYENFPEDDLLEFGFGGLVHDIGKTRLARRIIRKNSELTEKEKTIIRQHPQKGRTILRNAGYNETLQKIALQHHRRPDGSGYPKETTDIHPLAQIVSVIDEYEPLLASAPERSRPHPIRAYTRLKKQFYGYNETRTILENLIQCLGIYPVGCLTELSNGDIAVVVENDHDNLRRPQVKVVGSRDQGAYSNFYEVDLADIKHRKQVVKGKIYDDSTQVDRVLDYSETPALRKTVPAFIQQYHPAV